MKLIDITRVAQDAPIYPGSSPMTIERVCDMTRGDAFNASMITTGSHMGTHADAGCHFLPQGAPAIDQMELAHYYGPCRVVSVPHESILQPSDLAGKIDGVQRLVLHGGGKSYLGPEAAQCIIDAGVQTIVTDAWSIAPLGNEVQIHTMILSKGIAVVESVVLDNVPDGEYTLCAFPIKYGGCDGAPVRAVLIAQ